MKSFALTISSILVICTIATAEFYPVPTAADGEPPLNRPATTHISKNILAGSFIMSHRCTLELSEIISDLDQMNLNLLKKTTTQIRSVQDTKEWIRSASQLCPSRTPMCERTIYAALKLQLAMLHRILMEKNRPVAIELGEKRKKIRIRDRRDSFFGDIRDEYICSLLVAMEHISQVQEALGIRGTTDWRFPKNAKNSAQIEDFIIQKIKWIQARSSRLAVR